ncbi:MAG: PilZ domain-containing protein [Gammaproteobacteria bacterium]|nr:PilZ domain-containing protein [Gammaproteobacteria bacterium]
MSVENRKYPRIDVSISVELCYKGKGKAAVCTRNLSDGGLFLEMAEHPLPPLGTRVELKLTGTLGQGEKPPVVRAEVVRVEDNGIAVYFLDRDRAG